MIIFMLFIALNLYCSQPLVHIVWLFIASGLHIPCIDLEKDILFPVLHG